MTYSNYFNSSNFQIRITKEGAPIQWIGKSGGELALKWAGQKGSSEFHANREKVTEHLTRTGALVANEEREMDCPTVIIHKLDEKQTIDALAMGGHIGHDDALACYAGFGITPEAGASRGSTSISVRKL